MAQRDSTEPAVTGPIIPGRAHKEQGYLTHSEGQIVLFRNPGVPACDRSVLICRPVDLLTCVIRVPF